ncbi:5'-nucleotidase C-terminal domain-containing protein [Pseudosulfitobacter sp. DSM 107133]|uniref:5'-nucleotidase C-terminal domain-containing protein n=1 Tax=Pseudosulfitobacter sp. DSM 107133 TaxID=2883100 RepID=UPI000DF1DD70|nr:5'-nucleotidase C-terminal domain-containing protein [Pseudosulfitobacter sp. DSM 107133]UOA25994.1 Trifunctional nucleotide phosphoesterase protein YfkN [Pseudosulfitobacter sp. DSM 107133]
MVSSSPSDADPFITPPITAGLRILATTDMHMQLTAHDHIQAVTRPTGGLARVVTLMERARTEAGDALVLTFDNGDLLQGSAMAEVMASPAHIAQHPIAECLTLAGYDAIGLGNHDLDHGLSVAHRLLRGISCPVLSANFESSALPFVRPYTLLHREVRGSDGVLYPLCIGVTSALPEQTKLWNYRQLGQSSRFVSPVPRLAELIPRMKAEGADLIVVLAHAGATAANAPDRKENFALAAARLPEVSAIVCGHTHLKLPGPDHRGIPGVDADVGLLHNVPAVMPGFAANALGLIDIKLERAPAGWQIRDSRSSLRTAGAAVPEHPAILRTVSDANKLTQSHMAEPVGHTNMYLHSFFAHARADHATQMLALGMQHAIRTAARGTGLGHLPILAASSTVAKGGMPGPQNYLDVPPGAILRRDMSRIFPYSDRVWAICATGAQILEWLERSAVAFTHLTPDRPDQALIRPDVPGFQFDVICGLNVTFDPTQPARYSPTGQLIAPRARRVASAHWNGTPLDPKQQFLVAANSFRLSGGSAFPGLSPDKVAVRTEVSVITAAINALAHDPIPAKNPDAWRFKPGLGVTARLETAPQAERHLEHIAELAPIPIGLTDRGFLNLRLTL